MCRVRVRCDDITEELRSENVRCARKKVPTWNFTSQCRRRRGRAAVALCKDPKKARFISCCGPFGRGGVSEATSMKRDKKDEEAGALNVYANLDKTAVLQEVSRGECQPMPSTRSARSPRESQALEGARRRRAASSKLGSHRRDPMVDA